MHTECIHGEPRQHAFQLNSCHDEHYGYDEQISRGRAWKGNQVTQREGGHGWMMPPKAPAPLLTSGTARPRPTCQTLGGREKGRQMWPISQYGDWPQFTPPVEKEAG